MDKLILQFGNANNQELPRQPERRTKLEDREKYLNRHFAKGNIDVINKYEKCSILLAIRKMQIKAKLSLHTRRHG